MAEHCGQLAKYVVARERIYICCTNFDTCIIQKREAVHVATGNCKYRMHDVLLYVQIYVYAYDYMLIVLVELYTV